MLINGGMWQIGTEQGSGSSAGSITNFSYIPHRFVILRGEPVNLSSLPLLLLYLTGFFSVKVFFFFFVMAPDHTDCRF